MCANCPQLRSNESRPPVRHTDQLRGFVRSESYGLPWRVAARRSSTPNPSKASPARRSRPISPPHLLRAIPDQSQPRARCRRAPPLFSRRDLSLKRFFRYASAVLALLRNLELTLEPRGCCNRIQLRVQAWSRGFNNTN